VDESTISTKYQLTVSYCENTKFWVIAIKNGGRKVTALSSKYPDDLFKNVGTALHNNLPDNMQAILKKGEETKCC